MNPPRTAPLDTADAQLSLLLAVDDGAATAAPSSNSSTGSAASSLERKPGERQREILLAGELHPYRLRRGKRRTIGFQIDDHGLTVSAPRWVSLREIETAIVEKERWIRNKLSEWRDWRAKRQLPTVHWVDGGVLPYLGSPLTLRLRGDIGSTQLYQTEQWHELWLALPADAAESQVKDAVQAWLQTEARRVLGERLALLSQKNNIRYSAWGLSSARSQWGSCTHDGKIRLNWRLLHFALPVIDYVVAHELAHLKELNHSPRFWRAVGELMPDFEAAREQIKKVDLSSMPV